MVVKFEIRDVTKPKNGLIVYSNSYWICIDGNPGKALFYGTSPQCNNNKLISETLLKNKQVYPDNLGNLQVVFIEIAFVPQRN